MARLSLLLVSWTNDEFLVLFLFLVSHLSDVR